MLTKALAFDVFVIHRRFLTNLSDELVYFSFFFVVDRQFDLCMLILYVFCMLVQVIVL